MKNIILLLITISFSNIAQAQSLQEKKTDLKNVKKEKSETLINDDKKISKELAQSEFELIENTYGTYITYAMYDTWLPFKLGLLLSYGKKKNRLYEFGYQKASYGFKISGFELGNISDTKIYLTTRSHTWKSSFNFQYGLYYNAFDLSLGRSYLDLSLIHI